MRMSISARALRLPSARSWAQVSVMKRPMRARLLRLASCALLAALPLAASIVACGGGAPPATPPAPPAASSAAASASVSTAPTGTGNEPTTAPPLAPPPPAPVATSAVATTKTVPAWAACHQSFKAKGKDVSSDVEAMARACAAVTKMKPAGKTLTGKQADQDPPQSFPLDAKAGHCYRAYAQASDGIKDLDLVVKDSAGVMVGQDSTDDPSPVVLEDGALCFSKDDKATVVVSVGMGKGSYAVQVCGD